MDDEADDRKRVVIRPHHFTLAFRVIVVPYYIRRMVGLAGNMLASITHPFRYHD